MIVTVWRGYFVCVWHRLQSSRCSKMFTSPYVMSSICRLGSLIESAFKRAAMRTQTNRLSLATWPAYPRPASARPLRHGNIIPPYSIGVVLPYYCEWLLASSPKYEKKKRRISDELLPTKLRLDLKWKLGSGMVRYCTSMFVSLEIFEMSACASQAWLNLRDVYLYR